MPEPFGDRGGVESNGTVIACGEGVSLQLVETAPLKIQSEIFGREGRPEQDGGGIRPSRNQDRGLDWELLMQSGRHDRGGDGTAAHADEHQG